MVAQASTERTDGVAVVTMSPGTAGTMTYRLALSLLDRLRELEGDDDAKILVLRSDHEDSFVFHYEVAELLQAGTRLQGMPAE